MRKQITGNYIVNICLLIWICCRILWVEMRRRSSSPMCTPAQSALERHGPPYSSLRGPNSSKTRLVQKLAWVLCIQPTSKCISVTSKWPKSSPMWPSSALFFYLNEIINVRITVLLPLFHVAYPLLGPAIVQNLMKTMVGIESCHVKHPWVFWKALYKTKVLIFFLSL